MAVKMEVEIIKKETIKPFSPTPVHLTTFHLSRFDQIAPNTYTPLIMFYPNRDVDGNSETSERSNRLKISLSETLNQFYMLAGKVKGYASIHCNDEGADFIEARINCLLSDVLNPPNLDSLNIFLPIEIESSEAVTGRLLLVKATYFNCGGVAIGLSISHKVADGSSMSTFLKIWSDAALGEEDAAVPLFIGASLSPPPVELSIAATPPALEVPKCSSKCVTTRLVFDGTKIVELKNKVVSENMRQPTRVEVVSALIWKCAMSSSRSKSGLPKPSILCQYVNLRKWVNPPLPVNSIGNLVSYFTAETIDKNGRVDLHVLVEKLRNGIEEFTGKGVKKLQESGFATFVEDVEELGSMGRRDDIDFYIYSSWCKFQLYEADFGWGKPSWVSIASLIFSNIVVLMDTRDGEGIEAWVTLSEEEMVEFERNEELLAFASLNPSIII